MLQNLQSQCRKLLYTLLGLGLIVSIIAAGTGCSNGVADNQKNFDDTSVAGSVNSEIASTLEQTPDALERVESLDDLEAFDRGFDRSVALHILLASSEEQQLVKLIQQSREIEHYSQRRSIQTAIFQKFATLNPKAALGQIATLPRFERDALVTATFSQWALVDLDGATAHAKSLRGFQQHAALRGILQSRDDLSEELRREIARRIGNEQIAVEMIAQSTLSELGENPEQAWSDLVSDDISNSSQEGLLIQVAEAWFDQSGMGVLDEINASALDWSTRLSVLSAIVNRLVQTDPGKAFDYVSGMQDEGFNLLSIVARAWANLDPQSALRAALSIDSGLVSRNLQHSIVQVWASNDPQSILDNLDQLPEASRAMAEGQAIMAIARTSPVEAALLMAAMEDPVNRYSVAYTIVSHWVQTDVDAALDWVLSNGDLKDLREDLLPLVLNRLALENPELAMQTALNQPVSRNGSGMEYTVLSYLAAHDPQKALSMLPQVREGQTRLWAHISVGGALIRAGQTDSALKLATSLQESQRERYYRNLISTWASNDAKGLYDNIDRLPSVKTKSSAALTLITWNSWQKNLSEGQIDQVKNYLTSDDAEILEKGNPARTLGYRLGVEQGLVLPAPVSQ